MTESEGEEDGEEEEGDDDDDEEGGEEEAEGEGELLSSLLLLSRCSFSCPRTSTEAIVAGATAGDGRAFQSRPSRSAAFHGSGGVAPGPERR